MIKENGAAWCLRAGQIASPPPNICGPYAVSRIKHPQFVVTSRVHTAPTARHAAGRGLTEGRQRKDTSARWRRDEPSLIFFSGTRIFVHAGITFITQSNADTMARWDNGAVHMVVAARPGPRRVALVAPRLRVVSASRATPGWPPRATVLRNFVNDTFSVAMVKGNKARPHRHSILRRPTHDTAPNTRMQRQTRPSRPNVTLRNE